MKVLQTFALPLGYSAVNNMLFLSQNKISAPIKTKHYLKQFRCRTIKGSHAFELLFLRLNRRISM
jgi:hypothetical protein